MNIKDRVIIFDLEATCVENVSKEYRDGFTMETIEIGAIDNQGNTFQSFVKPVLNTELSVFCKNLTTIKQSDVDSADTFTDVFKEFKAFIGEDTTIMSWGNYDKNQLLKDFNINNITEFSDFIKENHINLKDYYEEVTGFKAKGMAKTLKKLNIQLEGTHHRGIDDAINLQKIYFKLKKMDEKNKNNVNKIVKVSNKDSRNR